MSATLHVTCPKCGKSGEVPNQFAGKDIHCKKCDARFIVPGPGEARPVDRPPGRVAAHAHGHEHVAATAVKAAPHIMPSLTAAAPAGNLLDSLSDEAGLTPLSDDDEKHARLRYEARVLSKDRVAHYDDHGNLLSETEYEERVKQGRGSVH